LPWLRWAGEATARERGKRASPTLRKQGEKGGTALLTAKRKQGKPTEGEAKRPQGGEALSERSELLKNVIRELQKARVFYAPAFY
jgi:hypothetical protein